MPDPEVLDAEVHTHEKTDALTLRRPDIPVTLSELAARKGEAVEIIEARIKVLETARKAAIRATHPEDWLLFKAGDEQGGQVVGYLQDSGCERVRDIFGISISNVSEPQKIAGTEAGVFHYLVRGDGRCTLTAQAIEGIEGGRSSTEDFCRDKTGAALELAVRKAARANLDGQIVRELAGLASVPVDELEAAWTSTHKKVEHCRRGRGFGSRSERLGANSDRAPDVEPPTCPHCSAKGVYRPAKDNRKAFYGCPNYAKHQDKKWIVDAEKWVADQQRKSAAPAAAEPPATAAAPAQNHEELKASDIPFGSNDSRGRRS